MSCNNCQCVENTPRCLTALIVGTITSNNADVFVFLRSARGRLERFSATSSGAGLVTINSSSFEFMNGMLYEIWVTLATAVSFENKEDITIAGDAVNDFECLRFKAEDLNIGSTLTTIATQTLTKCST